MSRQLQCSTLQVCGDPIVSRLITLVLRWCRDFCLLQWTLVELAQSLSDRSIISYLVHRPMFLIPLVTHFLLSLVLTDLPLAPNFNLLAWVQFVSLT